ncbi:MAG TPA: hypothetical protein VL576_00545 [Candidatus Paceibacterota bacterium]|jgi:glucose-6-phosphate 1-dehydrogenase|nr:hypothetical protein [Candidatus Paceibacterota bacterium]
MEKTILPTILIIFGITGDLSKRKLLPAIESLKEQKKLPEKFKLIGITRKEGVSIEGAETIKMDLDSAADYTKLKERLDEIEKEFGEPAQRLFYLSVAPTVSLPIIEQLDTSGLSKIVNTKLLLEKPFGTDQENGTMLIKNIGNAFVSEQVYRVDHYLAKDSVRALSKQHIEKEGLTKIEIVATETLTAEGRGEFYEQTGALRDFVQSHLLEVLATVLVDLPKEVAPAPGLPPYGTDARLKVLKQLSVPIDPAASSGQGNVTKYVGRGQYEGYRKDVNNENSTVETFVSVILHSSDPMLAGTNIELKTGKALDKKRTEVQLFYKDQAAQVISLEDKENAYTNVFLDAMTGDKTFFISEDEVLEDWRIVTPIIEAWSQYSVDLFFYKPGSSM